MQRAGLKVRSQPSAMTQSEIAVSSAARGISMLAIFQIDILSGILRPVCLLPWTDCRMCSLMLYDDALELPHDGRARFAGQNRRRGQCSGDASQRQHAVAP